MSVRPQLCRESPCWRSQPPAPAQPGVPSPDVRGARRADPPSRFPLTSRRPGPKLVDVSRCRMRATMKFLRRFLDLPTRPPVPAWRTARLVLEQLEDRFIPATFLVSTLADTGAGSLRA